MIERRRVRHVNYGGRDQGLPVREDRGSEREIRYYPRRWGRRWTGTMLHIWLGVVTVIVLLVSRLVRQSNYPLEDSLSLAALVSDKLSRSKENDLISFEIFSSPKPFLGVDKVNQIRAIESWLALVPRPRITLLGEGELYDEVAKTYGLRRMRDIDTNFLGVPLFNGMVSIANRSTAPVTVLINSDVMLFDDFPYTLQKIRRHFEGDWVAVAARWDVQSVPGAQSVRGPKNVRAPERQRVNLVNRIRRNGTLHTYGGIDVWAWNTGGAPLFDRYMPPFVFGRGIYDNWFTHEVIAAGNRAVIDVSQACTVAHVRHDYHLVSPSRSLSEIPRVSHVGGQHAFWNDDLRLKFEPYINSHLADRHGTYATQKGTILDAKYKMQPCYESEGICLFHRKNPHRCRCEYSSFVDDAQSDPYIVSDSRVVFCGLLTADSLLDGTRTKERYPVVGRPQPGEVAPFGLPLTFKQLLNVSSNRLAKVRPPVLLTVLNAKSKDLLMNLACNLRHIGIFQNLMIAALDEDLYRFAVTHGLPVYLEDTIFEDVDEESNAATAEHGATGNNALLSFSIRIMSRVLKTGRNVLLWSPGAVLLANPFPKLENQKHDIQLTSFAAHGVAADAAKNKVSTGILFARSNQRTLQWIKEVRKLEKSGSDHLRAVYEVSCGKMGEFRRGQNACKRNTSKTTISFLDRSVFGIFSKTTRSEKKGLLALQNIETDTLQKMEAIRMNNYLFVDEKSELCIYPDHIERHLPVAVPG